MTSIILIEHIRNENLFQGGEQGGIPISFLFMQAKHGEGPRLLVHPYPEIFVVQEGHATFTVGEDTLEVEGAHVLVGPAEVPHKFINSGEGILLMGTTHQSKQPIG